MIKRGCPVVTDGSGHEKKLHGTDAFPLACYEEDAGTHPVRPHWHDEFEFLYVQEGESAVHVGTREARLKKGECIFINSGQLHSVRGGILRSVVFHERAVAPEGSCFRSDITERVSASGMAFITSAEIPLMHDLIRQAWEAENTLDPDRQNLERYLVTRAMGLVKDSLRDEEKTQDECITARMKKLLRYIDLHLDEQLDNALLCSVASVSESVLLRMFRSTVGTSPMQYVLSLRLDKAERLIVTTERTISEIAMMCGFSDMSHFARTFRERKGMTPTARRRAREN